MATLSATGSAAQSSAPAKGKHGANVAYASYTTSASISAGDVLHMLKIPSGATVTDMAVSVVGPPAGTQIKVSVGDDADRDRYFDSQSLHPSYVYTMSNPIGHGHTYSAGSTTSGHVISITFDTAASVTATMTVKLSAHYDV